MKVVKNKTPKYVAGGLMAAYSIGKGIAGGIQAGTAFTELMRLKRDKPEFRVAPAIIEMANEPVSATFRAEADAQLRSGLSSSLGALGTAGARGILGGTQPLMQQYSRNLRAAQAQFDQQRINALQTLGQAETDVQNKQYQDWAGQVAGANASMDAGVQNIFGGLRDATRFAAQTELGLTDVFGTGRAGTQMNQGSIIPQNIQQQISQGTDNMFSPQDTGFSENPLLDMYRSNVDASREIPTNEDGGMITPGKFSHKSNPIKMVSPDGEVVGEATGNEVILNPEQAKKVEEESGYFRKLLKRFQKRK
jgi:hypothetical protein